MKDFMSLSTKELYSFDAFELDPARRVLLHNEEPVTLTPKAFEVLSYLVFNPERVVTKEELLKAIWPDSFVEEGNLPQYISALRKALGEKSCLIVTVPGRGYQFGAQVTATQVPVAPIESHPAMGEGALFEQRPGDILVQRVRERSTRVVYEDVPAAQPDPALQLAGATASRAKIWRWTAIAALVGVLIALAIFGWKRAHPPQISDVVLADFTNNTGDANFDHTLDRALEIDLAQTPFLNLLSRQKVKATLIQMQRKKDEMLTPELAAEVCERNNAQAVLHGAIANFGSKYLLTLAADSCVNGKRVAAYKAEANSKEDILRALDTIAGHVRRQLGESAASLERFQTPISQATTPSLEALRDYSMARERFEHGDWKATQQLLEHAIALDANFAAAYAGLGAAYSNRGDFAQASEYFKKGFELRDRATERERLQIEISYHTGYDHDLEEAIRSLGLLTSIYPNYEIGWGNLSNQYAQLGEYDKAVAAGEQAFRINPHSSYVDIVLAHAYEGAGRFADSQRIAGAAIADKKDTWEIHSILYQIAFAERDAARIASEGPWGISHNQAAPALRDLGKAAAAGGKLRAATEYFNRAHAEALAGGDNDLADEVLADLAAVLINDSETDKASVLLKQIKGDPAEPGQLAILQAASGDLTAARQFVNQCAARPEKNTILLYHHLPVVRATLALGENKPADAIPLLEAARPYQRLDYQLPSLRARAEIATGTLDAAAADYRLILANQGVDPISPLYPLAHLGLARVLALQSNNSASRGEYEKFFDAWKDADTDVPILKQARVEYSRLLSSGATRNDSRVPHLH
jgi:DNA-binding winged helix-turn-helix (wHTH) protein/tetratricopeptide (TPR) repeat protein